MFVPLSSAPSLPPHDVRPADLTGRRLGRALLGYLGLMILIITLVPFRFVFPPPRGPVGIWTLSDIVMNVLMFMPIGFAYQLSRPHGAPAAWGRALLIGLVVSGGVEGAQLFMVERYSSPIDLATNTLGAGLGAWAYAVAMLRVDSRKAVQSFTLELPLTGLVYLLLPLIWLVGLGSEGSTRRWLVLPLVAVAGAIMAAVYASYLVPRQGTHWVRLVLGAALWLFVALAPGSLHATADVINAGLVLGTVILLRLFAPARFTMERVNGAHVPRRFELPTLRLIMPFFAAYLVLSAVWPLDAAPSAWHAMLALLPAGAMLTKVAVYRALERVAAFSLMGYIIAQFHGRWYETLGAVAPRVLAWAAGLSLVLEGARGFRADAGASAVMFVLSLAAATFGGWLYLLQLAHIRALLGRVGGSTPSAGARAVGAA